jgi:HEAT repeat protein
MAVWKIHTSWALVAVLVTGVWGRWCGRPREAESAVREERAEPTVSGGVLRPRPAEFEDAPGAPSRESGSPASKADAAPSYTYHFLTLDQIRALIRSDRRDEWWQATLAVSCLVDPALKKELLLELISCKDDQIRVNTLAELKQTIGKDSVPVLQNALRTDKARWVRSDCAAMLGELGGEGTVEVLLQAVHDEDDRVRLSSAAALSRLGHPGPAADLIAPFTSQLDDPDGAVRRRAVEDLSSLRSPLALPALLRAVRDPSGEVRAAAARGLGSVGGSGVIPVLEGLLEDPVSGVAEDAKDALESLRAPKPPK